MAGPLEPRVELRSKWGRFKSSKKALNAPLVFCCGGIPLGVDFGCEGKSCVALPGEYMWPENEDGSPGSPSASAKYNGYSILTDFNVYTPMYTSGGKGSTGNHWKNYSIKTFATESWNELQTILTTYKIQPSAKIILGFSGGVAFVTNNIPTFGGNWTYWNTVLLAGAWAPKGKNDAGVKEIQKAKKSNKNTYYFSGGVNAGADDFANPGFDETATLYGKDFIKTSVGHMKLVPYTAKWIKDNVKVSSTGEAATPSGAATSAGTGGTPNTTPTGSGTGTSTETGQKSKLPTICELLAPHLPAQVIQELPALIKRFDITTMNQMIHFCGQCAHETGNWRSTVELGENAGAKYEGAVRLGNDKPGDGKKFKGRGYIQLTGRWNYWHFSKWLKAEDLTEFPDLVATKHAVLSAFFFMDDKGLWTKAKDAGYSDAEVTKITKVVNGGDNGLAERKKYTEKFRKILEGNKFVLCGEVVEGVIASSVTESNGTNAQIATASDDCNDLQKEDAKLKANESPDGAKEEEVAKDPLPPPKDETPVSLDGKYNHRFYILPTKEAKPLTLAEMVDKKQKYYKRYWAWRTEENPGYGIGANEHKLVSDDGKNLITGLVPYWPPHSGSFDDIKEPIVKGKWLELIKGQKEIQSFLDVPILLNAYDVGVYNDNIGYVFEAGNELHMTLLEKVFLTNKGSQIGIGNAVNTTITDKKNQDSSWREWPKWSGIWVDHCLKKSGYSLYGDINVNINSYHEKVLSGNKLINYPGNKEWKWKDLKAAGMQDLVFKPSKIWYETANLNSDELLKDTGDIAIFIVDYHIKKDGTLTERGQKLLDKVISLNWKLGVVSAVKSHTGQSNQLYAEVLVYLDKTGKMVTFGGNTTPRGADSIPGGGPYHIAVKETNFKDFAILAGDNWVNGAVFISNVKSAPEGHRVGGLDSKIYTTDIFKDYYKRIDTEKGKLTGRMYNFLLPYIDQKPAAPAPAKIEPENSNEVKHTKISIAAGNQGGKDGHGGVIIDTRADALAKGIIQKVPEQPNEELRSTAMADFVAMRAAAKAAGHDVTLSSSFRTWQDQVATWKDYPIRIMDPNNPKDKKLIKLQGIDHLSSKGDPSAVGIPIGYHARDMTDYREGSYHQKGRAIDFHGKGTTRKTAGGGNYQKYLDSKQGPNQKWVRKNGQKYGWFGYYNEIWHFNWKFDNTGKTV